MTNTNQLVAIADAVEAMSSIQATIITEQPMWPIIMDPVRTRLHSPIIRSLPRRGPCHQGGEELYNRATTVPVWQDCCQAGLAMEVGIMTLDEDKYFEAIDLCIVSLAVESNAFSIAFQDVPLAIEANFKYLAFTRPISRLSTS
jgi:hypothetical protein